MADGGANLPGYERILLRGIVADYEDRARGVDIGHGGLRRQRICAESRCQACVIGRAVMIEIVRAEIQAREAIKEIVFFVRGVIRADHADGACAAFVADLLQTPRDFLEGIFPTGGLELAVAANQRLANALRMIREIETEAAFAAEKFAVDAGLIAIIGAQDFIVADAQRRLAAIRAVRAGLPT